MKKVALSLIALLAAGSFAFAEDSMAGTTAAPISASLSANGWAQVGTDLDYQTWGFKNGTEAKLSLVLIGKGTNSKGDQGGQISVADIIVGLNASTDAATSGNVSLGIGDVTAKIVADNLYVKLAKWGSPSVNYSKDVDDDTSSLLTSNDAFYRYSGQYGSVENEFGKTVYGTDLGSVDPLASGAGIEVGYTLPSLLSIVANIDSETSGWQIKNNVEYKVEVSFLAVEKLTLKAGYGATTKENTDKGFGAQVAYDLGVIAPFASINYKLPATGDASNVIIAGAQAPLVDGVKVAGGVILDGASVAGKTKTGATGSIEVTKVIPFGLKAGVQLIDLTAITRQTTTVFGQADFTVADGVALWVKGSYDTEASSDAALYAKARVEFSKIFPLTVIAVEYDSNDYLSTVTDAKKVGQLFAEAKVSY